MIKTTEIFVLELAYLLGYRYLAKSINNKNIFVYQKKPYKHKDWWHSGYNNACLHLNNIKYITTKKQLFKKNKFNVNTIYSIIDIIKEVDSEFYYCMGID